MVKVFVIDQTDTDIFAAAIENVLNNCCKGMANLIVSTNVEQYTNGFGNPGSRVRYTAIITDNQVPQISMPTNNRRM